MLQVQGKVTLDLNGFTLDRNRSSAHVYGSAIYVKRGATLTIADTSEARTGTITGGFAEMGGGIWNEGNLTINGGTITGNHANSARGAGGGIFNNGEKYMNGGTVSNNSAGFGGGIFSDEGCTFWLINAAITGNSAVSGNGGGICSWGTGIMSGCSISDNTAKTTGGGVFADKDTA